MNKLKKIIVLILLEFLFLISSFSQVYQTNLSYVEVILSENPVENGLKKGTLQWRHNTNAWYYFWQMSNDKLSKSLMYHPVDNPSQEIISVPVSLSTGTNIFTISARFSYGMIEITNLTYVAIDIKGIIKQPISTTNLDDLNVNWESDGAGIITNHEPQRFFSWKLYPTNYWSWNKIIKQ